MQALRGNIRGFSMMEIMVVVVVIAILSSIGGPMVTNVTNAGRITATKAALNNLKTALNSFKADLGQYPRLGVSGEVKISANYIVSAEAGLGYTTDDNCLVTDAPGYWKRMGLTEAQYKKRWKGPYIDGDPSDFLYDPWGNEIRYGHFEGRLYLWSSGPDGEFETTATIQLALLPTLTAETIGAYALMQAETSAGTATAVETDDPPKGIDTAKYLGDDIFVVVARTNW